MQVLHFIPLSVLSFPPAFVNTTVVREEVGGINHVSHREAQWDCRNLVCTLPVERKEKEYTERTHAYSPHAYAIASELGGLAGHVGKWQL